MCSRWVGAIVHHGHCLDYGLPYTCAVYRNDLCLIQSLQSVQIRFSTPQCVRHGHYIPLFSSCPSLSLQVEHLFIVGSPLGLFIAMRDAEKHVDPHHRSAQSLLPYSVCKRIHNIYHPADAVVRPGGAGRGGWGQTTGPGGGRWEIEMYVRTLYELLFSCLLMNNVRLLT